MANLYRLGNCGLCKLTTLVKRCKGMFNGKVPLCIDCADREARIRRPSYWSA